MKRKSVRQRYSGRSFAQAAAQISKKYEDRDTNPLSKRSFMAEMEELVKLQELVRAKEASIDTIQEYRAPKMQWGGLLKFPDPPGYMDSKALVGLPQVGLQSYMPSQTSLNLGQNAFFDSKVFPQAFTQSSTTPKLLPSLNQSFNTTDFSKLPLGVSPTISDKTLKALNKYSSSLPDTGFAKDESLFTTDKTLNKLGKPLSAYISAKDGIQTLPSVPSVTKTESNSIFTPMILSKTAELFGKGLMALSGYDKVSPQLNPFESEIREDLRKMKFDNTAITQRVQGEMERARGLAKGIRSEAVRQALYQNAQNQANQALSEVDVQGQAMNNQYRQAKAGALNNLGQQSVQARQYAEQLNNQSKAGYQMGLQTMLESVGNIGQQVTNYKANIAQQKLLASALQTADFKFGDVGQVIAKAVNDGQLTMDDFFEINKTAKNSKEAMDLAKKKMDENLRAMNKKG